MLLDDDLVKRQLAFFAQGHAGCLFAAMAARDPRRHGWIHVPLHSCAPSLVDANIISAIEDPQTTTLSLLFPGVRDIGQFIDFVEGLKDCSLLALDQHEKFEGFVCLGFRARIRDLRSYVTGFGDFSFLPRTRRAPCTELAMRVKPRPDYEFVFKQAPPGIIHLADMNMYSQRPGQLQRLWDDSFAKTRQILGAEPDIRSAARTTYSIPLELFERMP